MIQIEYAGTVQLPSGERVSFDRAADPINLSANDKRARDLMDFLRFHGVAFEVVDARAELARRFNAMREEMRANGDRRACAPDKKCKYHSVYR